MGTNNIISIPPEHIPTGMKAVHIGMPFLQTAMDELSSFNCKKVFVMANKSSIKFIEVDDTKLVNILQSKGLLAAPLCTSINMGGAEEGLLKACDDAYTAHADLVMTVGGGAVQDAGKLVRLWLSTKSDNDKKKVGCTVEGLQAATEQDPMPELPPQICMPNSFAMAEATHIAGLVTKLKSKSGAAHAKLLPTVIIYDPVLSSELPDWVRFGTSLRGVEHAIGAITHPKANENVRIRALEGLSILGDNLTKLISHPESATLQSNLYMGGFIAIRALIMMGCYPTIGHLIENQYSAKFNVHQGSCSGVLCARIMDYHYINSREYQQRISAALGTENKPAPQIVRDLIALFQK